MKPNSTLGKVLAASARRMDLPMGASAGETHLAADDDQDEEFGTETQSATILLLF